MATLGKTKTIETRVVQMPLGRALSTKNVHVNSTYFVLVRATDDDGVVGHGGLWCLRPDLPELLEATIKFMASHIVGQPLFDMGAISDALDLGAKFIGRHGLSVFGTSAIKMALEDVVCRRLELSLAQMLGQVRTHVPAYKIGLFVDMDHDTLQAECRKANEEGFRAIKIWMNGADDFDKDVERVTAAREALLPGTKMMFDITSNWNLPAAVRVLDRMCALEPFWIEDPVPPRDLVALRRVVQQSTVPICTGENEYLPESFRGLLEAGVQYIQPDLERLGGVREWIELADMADPYGAVVVPHCFPNISLQLGAATRQRETWVEYVPWFQRIFENKLLAVDGLIEVPTAPGIGFDLDFDEVENLAMGDWRVVAGG